MKFAADCFPMYLPTGSNGKSQQIGTDGDDKEGDIERGNSVGSIVSKIVLTQNPAFQEIHIGHVECHNGK